ncbi:MAG: diguanylate cyclase [Coxiellaceae bacterium]|nr:diguanylate cyclase [Coxiellaceae bacterium]
MTRVTNNADIVANILVVDDNQKNLVAMKNILSDVQANTLVADSGEEALRIVLNNEIAVIYLDVQMPDMDGFEVAQILQQNSETTNIPIVFVTAISHDESNVVTGYGAGAIDYLHKPINPTILLAKTKIFIKLYEQQKQLEMMVDKLEVLATTDTLTQLYNRHYFNLELDNILVHATRHGRRCALMLLDLDDFKVINDSHGHDIGDELLKHVAKTMDYQFRKSDVVARIGGDEFAIVLREFDNIDNVKTIAENLLQSLSGEVVLGEVSVSVGVSIGIAVFPDDARTMKSLIKSADLSLYAAKESGKSCYSTAGKKPNS